jgi:hypothetical protein
MTPGMLVRRIARLLGEYFYTIDLADDYPITSDVERPNNVFYIQDKNHSKKFKITVEEITKGAK